MPVSCPACRRAIRAPRWALALGSATVSPLEMAGLYAGLANGGKFAPPPCAAIGRGRSRCS
jgi:Membrane carboxypeptidase/penicillin-binding protein